MVDFGRLGSLGSKWLNMMPNLLILGVSLQPEHRKLEHYSLLTDFERLLAALGKNAGI